MNSKRAVAYVRVSTQSKSQIHSFEFQSEYWKRVIKQDHSCEYVDIYADLGISGRSMRNRPQFNRMLKDAQEGKFDIIYTKSVARFSRNTEELLRVVRQLRSHGVAVYFSNERINSLDGNADMMLTIAVAIAQEDLKIYSENQRWSTRRRFQKGHVIIGNKILGYKMNKSSNTLVIEPEGAEVVKKIFRLYREGMGMNKIALQLENDGDKNADGRTSKWGYSSIRYILSNERYTGNSLQQKTTKEDGCQRKNLGQAKQYYIANTHKAIIEEAEFNYVQACLKQRTNISAVGKLNKVYEFTSLVHCGLCGCKYTHKINNPNTPYSNGIWICQNQRSKGVSSCGSHRIKDKVLKEKFVECYNEFIDGGYYRDNCQQQELEFKQLLKQEQELIAMKISRLIDIVSYSNEIEKLHAKKAELRSKIDEKKIKNIVGADYAKITQFTEEKVYKFLDKVTMHRGTVTFTFINGVSISRAYDNGRAGNKKGWRNKVDKEVQ